MTDPRAAQVLATLQAGLAHHDAGRLGQALQAYNAVLAADPNNRHGLHFAGVALQQAGLNDKARPFLERAAEVAPTAPEILNHLGVVRQAVGDRAGAEAAFRRAVAIDATTSTAMMNLVALLSTDRPADAFAALREGLAKHPDQTTWRETAAALANDLDQPEVCVTLLDEGGEVLAGSANATFLRSVALRYMDKLRQSADWLRRTILLLPENPKAYANLGVVQQRSDQSEDAVLSLCRAHTIIPGDPSITSSLGMSLLAAGNLKEGWAVAKARHDTPEIRLDRLGLPPVWSGEDGHRVFVWSEQGLGDEIMFANCLVDLDRAKPGSVLVECEPRLRPLFARSFPAIRFTDWEPRQTAPDGTKRVDFAHLIAEYCMDRAIGLGDLCPLLRPTIADFPDAKGYLSADDEERERWRTWLAKFGGGPKVGFCWRSGAMTTLRTRGHLYPLIADLGAALALPETHLISLQYDDVSSDLAEMNERFRRSPHVPPKLDQRHDIDRVAALIAELDLVITAGTAVNALAGAMGVPTINFVAHPNWMMLGTRGTPWFPNTDVVCRGVDRSWSAAMEDVATTARRVLSSGGGHLGF